jgi:hypothetical protein
VTYGGESEPMPLRLRLGPRADAWWQPSLEGTVDAEHHLADVEVVPADADAAAKDLASAQTNRVADSTPELTKSGEAPATAASEQLDRAIQQTDRRVDRWITDQQQRLAAGLDLMLAQLKERRQEELAQLEAWKASERQRVDGELAQKQERFHERLLAEVMAFEEQLALRLNEQEERLARWLAEAGQLAEQRFETVRMPSGAPAGEGETPTS